MKTTTIIVAGLFGGISSEHYKPLARMLGAKEFLLYRAGMDWNPKNIANNIRRIDGKKIVICLSMGAMVGDIIAEDENTEVYYICPYLGAEFLNRKAKGYAYHLRYLFKILATILMVLAWPFKRHRWYPLKGGTKPDGWFLSVYAICRQLRFAFSKTPCELNAVDGVVFSYGDDVVEPTLASALSLNAVAAWTDEHKGPAHVNLREEGEEFGNTTGGNGTPSKDAKAYFAAFNEVLEKRSR